MLNLQLIYSSVNLTKLMFQFGNLLKQLGLSGWTRIAIYLFLDYILLPADLIHKILPATQFTDLLSSLSTISLSLAIYIVPELREITKRMPN